MDSTGEILRRARNERHLTLDEVASRTRINRKYLAAIESGDRESIPGGFFYKSFARQYAAALSTDEDNVLEEVEHSLALEEPPAPPPPDEEVLKALATRAEQEHVSSPLMVNRSATTYAVLLALAIAGTSGLYVLWHRAQQAQAAGEAARPVPQVRKQEPPATQPPAAAQQPAPAQTAAPAQAEAPPPQPQPKEQTSAPPPVITPAEPAAPTSTTAPATEAPAPAPNPDDKIALSVSAKEPTWFAVSVDGKTLYSGTLQPGQSKTFAARENARMRIGNAGGIDVTFNGKPLGPLGTSSQVLTVLFTPENFEIVKPQPPPEQPQPQPN